MAMIYLGLHGSVVALDRATGQQIWLANLKGSDFVNVLLDGDRVIATTKGEVFCLDAVTGAGVWQNKLPGMGTGLVTIATATSGPTPIAPFREKRKRDEEAAAAAAAAGA